MRLVFLWVHLVVYTPAPTPERVHVLAHREDVVCAIVPSTPVRAGQTVVVRRTKSIERRRWLLRIERFLPDRAAAVYEWLEVSEEVWKETKPDSIVELYSL